MNRISLRRTNRFLHVLEHQEPQQTDRGWPRSLRTSSRRAYFALLRGTKEPPVVMGCPIRLLQVLGRLRL